jgi:putative flippase GtrA
MLQRPGSVKRSEELTAPPTIPPILIVHFLLNDAITFEHTGKSRQLCPFNSSIFFYTLIFITSHITTITSHIISSGISNIEPNDPPSSASTDAAAAGVRVD